MICLLNEPRDSVTTTTLFMESLYHAKRKLCSIPSILILKVPLSTNEARRRPYIIPDREIIFNYRILMAHCQKCLKSNQEHLSNEALLYCEVCSRQSTTSKKSGKNEFFCEDCYTAEHNKLSSDQAGRHEKSTYRLKDCRMNLFAVITFDGTQYTAFAKSNRSNKSGQWLYFNSYSRIPNRNEYISCIEPMPKLSDWLNDPTRYMRRLNKPQHSRQLTNRELERSFPDEYFMRKLFSEGTIFLYDQNIRYQRRRDAS